MKLIAHRGGAGLRVENTLAAFAHAIELGAAGAELDVHLTRDGEVVVHHDECLNRGYCRDAAGRWLGVDRQVPIADQTMEQLRQYEIGVPDPASDYARVHPRIQPVAGQRVPTLREVVRLAQAHSRDFILVIEIKTSLLHATVATWGPLVDATLAVIAEEAFGARAILCSFDWGALRYARDRRPGLETWFTGLPLSWLGDAPRAAVDDPPAADYLEAVRTASRSGHASWFGGYDPRKFAGGYPEAIAAAGGNAWFMYHRDCTPESHRAAHRCGLASAAWSGNLSDVGELRRLVNIGVDDLVVDYPDLVLDLLSRPA